MSMEEASTTTSAYMNASIVLEAFGSPSIPSGLWRALKRYRKRYERGVFEQSHLEPYAALGREYCGGKKCAHFTHALLLASIVLILITPG
jgi:hypothetical protein